ncbi:MAG: hypothetical protein ACRBN8_00540 [Nannocystales bacterium]
MAWIPSQDPWGVGMLGSTAVFGVSLIVINSRRMAIRSRTGSVMMAGVAATAFLACAAMGTLQQVAQGSTEASDASPSAAVPAAVSASPTPADEADAGGLEADPALAPPNGAEAAPEVEPAPARGSALESLQPLPSPKAERQTAIRKRLRSARTVYESQKNCKDAKAVGQAWAGVASIPADAQSARVKAVARKLEGCRKQVRWATAYNVHRDRVAGREAFEQPLKKRLRDAHDINVSIALTGDNHQRIRVGSGGIDEALAKTIVTQTLKDELTELGFERVVLADAKQSWKTVLEPRPESAYVADELAPYGLDAKLTLGED